MEKKTHPIYSNNDGDSRQRTEHLKARIFQTVASHPAMQVLYAVACGTSIFFLVCGLIIKDAIVSIYFGVVSALLYFSCLLLKMPRNPAKQDMPEKSGGDDTIHEQPEKRPAEQKESGTTERAYRPSSKALRTKYNDNGRQYPAYRGYEHSYETLGDTDRAGNKITWVEKGDQQCITEQEESPKTSGKR